MTFVDQLSPMRAGVMLALLTLLFGFCLGGVFGLFEDRIKEGFHETAQQTLGTSDPEALQAAGALVSKSWSYMKRAHLHANGLGTAALALILLLALLSVGPGLARATALALGLGALGYSSFWMFAALRTPIEGSSGAAKEALSWLAVPTASLCLVGLVLVFYSVVGRLYRRTAKTS